VPKRSKSKNKKEIALGLHATPIWCHSKQTSNNARCDCNCNPPWLCSALNHLGVPSFLLPPLLPIEPKVATRAKSLPRSSRPDSQWRRRRRRTRRSGPFPVLSAGSAASSSPVPLNLQLHPHKVRPKKSQFSTRGPHTAATCSSTARPPPSSLQLSLSRSLYCLAALSPFHSDKTLFSNNTIFTNVFAHDPLPPNAS
jgi:hypothetical protein